MEHQQPSAGRKGLVVFCQHGIGDHLTAPLMLDYIIRLQQQIDRFDVLFITEEAPGSPVPEGIEERLRAHRMQWLPLRYDVRGRQWLQRIRNMWRMLWATRSFMRAHRRGWLLGFLSYGGSYAVLASRLGLGPSVTVNFEPHSRYMTEMGNWAPGALRTRVTAWLERMQMKHCAAMVLPTSAGRDLALSYNASGNFTLQGVTIDARKALFDPVSRAASRSRYGWNDEIVLVYVGKFDGIYHSIDEMMRFMQQVVATDAGMRFLVISQQAELDRLRAHSSFSLIAGSIVLQPPVQPDELHKHLSAADIGIVAIPNTPAQVFRSPLKSAHYWAAGLPLVIPEIVADDARLAREEDVGIVVNDLPVADAAAFCASVRSLLTADRHAVRERCMSTALRHRDTSNMVNELKRILT